jgi:hypothetical protein
MKVIISRTYGKFETLGIFLIVDDQNLLHHCVCLELPSLGNQHNISCINEGVYKCKKEYHIKFGWHFRIYDVPGRDGILIHTGNYAAGVKVNTEGCILVGTYFVDINQDGNLDVAESIPAMNKILSILPNEFQLHILS